MINFVYRRKEYQKRNMKMQLKIESKLTKAKILEFLLMLNVIRLNIIKNLKFHLKTKI